MTPRRRDVISRTPLPTSFAPSTNCRDAVALRMSYQTTVGWSLLSSGIVTLVLKVLPGDSLWWGIGLLVLGVLTLYVRQ